MILDDSAVEMSSLVIKRIVCSGYICYRMNCIKCGHEFDQVKEIRINLECEDCR